MYEQVRKLEPHRTEGMEIYSTILWHMRKEIELSYLAHELGGYIELHCLSIHSPLSRLSQNGSGELVCNWKLFQSSKRTRECNQIFSKGRYYFFAWY